MKNILICNNISLAVPCRAVPCRAVPCRAVPCRAVPWGNNDAEAGSITAALGILFRIRIKTITAVWWWLFWFFFVFKLLGNNIFFNKTETKMIKTGMPNKEDKVLTFSNNQLIIETPEGAVKSFKLELDENNLPCVNPEYELLKPPQTRCLQCEGELSCENIELFNGFCSAECLNRHYHAMEQQARYGNERIPGGRFRNTYEFNFIKHMSQVAYNIRVIDEIVHSAGYGYGSRIHDCIITQFHWCYSNENNEYMFAMLPYRIGNSEIRTVPPSAVVVAGIYNCVTDDYSIEAKAMHNRMQAQPKPVNKITELFGTEPKLKTEEYLDAHQKYLYSLGIKKILPSRQNWQPNTWRKHVTFWPLIELP